MSKKGILVLQWNTGGLANKANEFKNFLLQTETIPDVICVQETLYNKNSMVSFPGYEVLRKDGTNGQRGVAFLIRKEISYMDFEYIDSDIEGVSVKIPTVSGVLEIVNLYWSPSVNIDNRLFTELFAKSNVLLCGDFNAKSTLWGSDFSDRRGKFIENMLDESDLVVLNNGSPTRFGYHGFSHIDISFASPDISNRVSWEVLDNSMGSDHQIISLSLDSYITYEELHNPKWIFNKADWSKFASLCDLAFSSIDVSESVDDVGENIAKAIYDSAFQSIPQSKGTGKKKSYYWNEKCEKAVKDRENARRKYRSSYELKDFVNYKKCRAMASKIIKSSKRRSWRSFCSSLSSRSKLGSVWKVVKGINGVGKSPSIPAVRSDNDSYSKDNFEKANIFAQHFTKISGDANYSVDFQQHKVEFEQEHDHVFKKRQNDNSILNVDFKMSEFLRALKKCKNTSPGKDMICYQMFRHLSTSGRIFLLSFFNRVWRCGEVPQIWCHSIIVPILKPGKPKCDPISYRPIALTSNLCKLFERVVTFRLTWFLEKHNLLNESQSGFRKQRSTTDQLIRLSDSIIKSFGQRSSTLGVFLDFEKAYDMVWRKGVLYKAHKLGIGGNMFNFLLSFLSSRKIQVRIGSTLSNALEVQNGVPQGSVISPILFLIAINDLCPVGVETSIFADDTAFWISGKNVKSLYKSAQKALDYIQRWCNNWGFKVSISKTSYVLFSRKRKLPKMKLKYNGSMLKKGDSVKFLGLIFDKKLLWRDHIDYLVNKCRKRINLLKTLSGSKWGADKATMVIVYKSLIRSIIDYGSEIYDSACISSKLRLDRIQSQCLRICSGALKCTPISALEVDCGAMPLDLRRRSIQVKAAIRYAYTNNSTNSCFQDCDSLLSPLFKAEFKPIYMKVKDIFLERIPSAISVPVASSVPPWAYDPIVLDTSLHEKVSKKLDSPHFILSTCLERMSSYSYSLHIYTDGSKINDRTGCAFYVPFLRYEKKFRLTNNSSVFQAELIAILKAFEFLVEKPPRQCTIFSDSLSALQALNDDCPCPIVQEILYYNYCLYNRGVLVTCVWIPSHIGISGNEYVDRLAKDALSFVRHSFHIPRTYKDLGPFVSKIFLSLWQERWDFGVTGRFFHSIVPEVSLKVSFSDSNKIKQTALTRLRFGKCLLNDTFHMFRKHPTGYCDFCLYPDSVEHFLLQCIDFQDHWLRLVECLLKKDLQVSAVNLLKNECFYNDIWEYVQLTGKVL